MTTTIRWGILGTGNIARQFATGLSFLKDAELVAVGSRSQASADAFADRFGVPHRHPRYEALAGDPEVDAPILCQFFASNADGFRRPLARDEPSLPRRDGPLAGAAFSKPLWFTAVILGERPSPEGVTLSG